MGTVTAGAQKVCKSELIFYLKRQIYREIVKQLQQFAKENPKLF